VGESQRVGVAIFGRLPFGSAAAVMLAVCVSRFRGVIFK